MFITCNTSQKLYIYYISKIYEKEQVEKGKIEQLITSNNMITKKTYNLLCLSKTKQNFMIKNLLKEKILENK